MGCDDRFETDADRTERKRDNERYRRLENMRDLLAKTPAADFTADYTISLCVVMDPSIIASHMTGWNNSGIDHHLDRLDAFFAARAKNKKK